MSWWRRLSAMPARQVITGIALIVAVAWVGRAALKEPDLPAFTASGEPRSLPAGGTLEQTTLEEFEGLLVGQLGRPVVVNVWASWCAPCRTEMPLLQEAADAYEGRAVILGVASNDDPDAARQFLDDMGLTYPNVFDTSGDIRVALRLTAYPTTYVFDAEGVLRSRVNGGISEQRLAGLIDDVLP